MTVSGIQNSVYTLKALMADLGLITRAAGYTTDVKTVKMPDYAPDDEDWRTMLGEECPAILVWLSDESDPVGRQNIAEDRPIMRVYMVGIVKQQRGLQASLQGLASDVRRVMRSNPNRDYPGLAVTNTWAVNTSSPGGKTFDFIYRRDMQKATAGLFESFWDIEYRFPRSTG